ncbi:MAG: LPS export ABC transporter permease LptG [Candidatus Eisenbacteria bacterium]|uniref:LPS export ABC transporter permease LptG n=1 Tax=Eiseniibacteriota bacterium TaxID=2212470 RepID=A0A9D6QIL7_UNCEI|nr:LPS export ABC transporter permease LptG [Candidatus Eisenbacteria bacterium]MBI3539527.1 LPS export ABC transporter permease LptG [Candidatus Eisenbacteria bacterium]
MRILDRYLLREFSLYLALGLVGFLCIFMVVDVIEKVDVFLDHHAATTLVLRYYLFRTPEVIVQVLPVALLLATFLALGQLNKFGELTAMRSTGLSLMRILAPVFVIAAGGVIVSLLLGELVVPNTNRERDRIFDVQIRRLAKELSTERADVTYLGSGGRIYYMRLYVIPEQRMHEVSVQEFNKGTLARRIDAAEATWDGRRWVFTSGFLRTFENGDERAQPFDRLSLPGIDERPENFAREGRRPDELNFFELRDYVFKLRASGARVANYLVDLHMKLAFPLIDLIVILIGAPIATRLRARSAALGFGLSVSISFAYYAFMQSGKALGHNGALPPYLAAWMGDIVFGIVGVVLMFRAQRS